MTQKINSKVTDAMNFFQGHDPYSLINTYGSPLYVYNERIFRTRCKEMRTNFPNFIVNYAIKANSNLTLLSIAREEGLKADVSSLGEIEAALRAGFKPDELLFIVNNASGEEMNFAVEHGITVSVDSLSQLDIFGKLKPKNKKEIPPSSEGRVRLIPRSDEDKPPLKKLFLRFNTGIGGGHHHSVVTSGDDTKFGIMEKDIPEVKILLEKYNLTPVGINHHIGSGPEDFEDMYYEGAKALLKISTQFEGLSFVDFGGGFPIPYEKQSGELPLELSGIAQKLNELVTDHTHKHVNHLKFMIEPGRYICAESGVLLGTIHSIKDNGVNKYVGCDIGFSVLARHTLYQAHHDVEIYRQPCSKTQSSNENGVDESCEVVSIVGNMCESGDYVAKDRKLPTLQVDDLIGVLDAGAYGYSMSSLYNMRPRPAEVLIRTDDTISLIRRRDTIEDMLNTMRI